MENDKAMKPCPFCGSDEGLGVVVFGYEISISCGACGTKGPYTMRTEHNMDYQKAANAARDLWNKRSNAEIVRMDAAGGQSERMES